ncbi:MAG: hypothetical protein AB1403_10415 [Candidatus Riflebacteria bacterium]
MMNSWFATILAVSLKKQIIAHSRKEKSVFFVHIFVVEKRFSQGALKVKRPVKVVINRFAKMSGHQDSV